MTNNNKNPLSKLIRTPQIYVRLPSGGRYNKEKIDFTSSGEVPIRATTARDDILLKNPDALLNGDATEKTLISCVPEIPNIKELPMNDVEVLILAVQFATLGDKYEFKIPCPKCSQENTYQKSIRQMLESITEIPEINSVTFTEGEAEITVILKPHTFENHTRASLIEFDTQKRMKYIKAVFESNLSETEKLSEIEKLKKTDETEYLVKQQVTEVYTTMANLAMDLLIESIIQINIKYKNSVEVQMVTEKEYISEYVKTLSTEKYKLIKAKLEEVMTYGLDKNETLTCSAIITETVKDEVTGIESVKEHVCGHEWKKQEVGYDHSSFSDNT